MFVNTLLDEEAPVVIRAVVVVFGFPALGEAGHSGLAFIWGDEAEEVEFDKAGPLAWGKFVLVAEGVEEGDIEEFGSGHETVFLRAGRGRGDGGGEFDLGEGAVVAETGVVAVVAQVVKGFVWVFDGDFEDVGVAQKGAGHGVVEVGAVGVMLVGFEDEELGYSCAGGEGAWVKRGRRREGECLHYWFLFGRLVCEEAIGG